MFAFFISDINLPYTIAISIVFLFTLIEILGLLVGLSLLEMFDNISPFDLDADSALPLEGSGLTSVFDWLCINRLPMLIWLILLLTHFAITGFSLNFIAVSSFEWQPSLYISLPVTICIALILTHFVGAALAKIIPKNDSSAVSTAAFNGKLARITIGTATKGNPAEAVLTDDNNQKHYVMVEPAYEHERFTQGTEVVIVEKLTSSWLAIPFN